MSLGRRKTNRFVQRLNRSRIFAWAANFQPLIKRVCRNIQQLGDRHFVDALGDVAVDFFGMLVELQILRGAERAPSFMPSLLRLAKASFVRELMKSRSISATRPSTVATILDCMESSKTIPFLVTCKWTPRSMHSRPISSTCSVLLAV